MLPTGNHGQRICPENLHQSRLPVEVFQEQEPRQPPAASGPAMRHRGDGGADPATRYSPATKSTKICRGKKKRLHTPCDLARPHSRCNSPTSSSSSRTSVSHDVTESAWAPADYFDWPVGCHARNTRFLSSPPTDNKAAAEIDQYLRLSASPPTNSAAPERPLSRLQSRASVLSSRRRLYSSTESVWYASLAQHYMALSFSNPLG